MDELNESKQCKYYRYFPEIRSQTEVIYDIYECGYGWVWVDVTFILIPTYAYKSTLSLSWVNQSI